ncbi:hypothetical protein Tco_0227076 [Tanacetum coccineum]
MNEDYCEQNSCYYPNSSGFDHPQPPQDSVDHQGILQVLNKMEEKLEEIIRDRRKEIEDMREEIDEVYERDCEIRIQKLKQDFNEWGSKGDIIARNSTSKAITPDLPIEEPDNSLNMGDEHLNTIPAMELDKVIKSSVENLVPIPSEFKGISDDTCDVPNCDDNRVHVESELVESLISRDTSIDNSSKIDPIFEEFAGELSHMPPITQGISFQFWFYPALLVPPPEPPDIEILKSKINNFDVLYNDESFEPREDENIVVPNVEGSILLTFVIRTFFISRTRYHEGFLLYLASME